MTLRTKLRTSAAVATLGSILLLPVSSAAQDREESRQAERDRAAHDRAVRQQNAHDAQHHTGAKIIGGSAAGGAVIGGLAGGGKGALIGGAAGAGGGAIANKVRKDKAIKKRENREYQEHHDYPR